MSMKNKTDKSSITNLDEMSLDNMFAQARKEESDLCDDNFTKVVLNSLPNKLHRVANKRYYPNILSLIIGLVVAYLVIEPTQLVNKIIIMLPDNILISFTMMNMLFLFMLSCSIAATAWWSVESKSRI